MTTQQTRTTYYPQDRVEQVSEQGHVISSQTVTRPEREVPVYVRPEKVNPLKASHIFDEAVLQARIEMARATARLSHLSREPLNVHIGDLFEPTLKAKLDEGYTINFGFPIRHRDGVQASSHCTLNVPEARLNELADAAEAEARKAYEAELSAAQAAFMESELARRVAEHQEAVRREREQAEAELADVLMREIAAELEAANTQPAPTIAAKKTTTKSKP
ncbi:hypothetical protein [Pseudomonas oryzihabitans]|uniref:hypothetical protein n=1 Tax=Pseudomonas oryzihabitans TaxID=47885 RepID=UPI0036418346